MKSEFATWVLLTLAVALGSLTVAGVSGCLEDRSRREANGAEWKGLSEGVESPSSQWTQWGGDSHRNNHARGVTIPERWNVGRFSRQTGEWEQSGAENIRWVAPLGSLSYGNPVVGEGRVLVGTNNGRGFLARYPARVDLGCLLCFDVETGQCVWQYSSEKLSSGRTHDWPLQGICSTPLIEEGRVYCVTNRGEVVCLALAGEVSGEPQVIWRYDMMAELGISQVFMCASSVTVWGEWLFVNTGNGFDEAEPELARPEAASFLCLHKKNGTLVWSNSGPGGNVLQGQWSSPAVADIGGSIQAIFAGGDGWLYSFAVDGNVEAQAGELLWKFDCNPKEARWESGGRGEKNQIVGTPMIHRGLVYVAVGQDPEAGGGQGGLWCIDPSGRGDVSAELLVRGVGDREELLAGKREGGVDRDGGERVVKNPRSAAVWYYQKFDTNGDGEIQFEEEMHRSISTVSAIDDLIYIADLDGIVHCLAAQGDGRGGPIVHYTYDMGAAIWGSALIADGRVFIGDDEGDLVVFRVGAEFNQPVWETNLGSAMYSTPVATHDTLYLATKDRLLAVGVTENGVAIKGRTGDTSQ